jgi:hypothetical protein
LTIEQTAKLLRVAATISQRRLIGISKVLAGKAQLTGSLAMAALLPKRRSFTALCLAAIIMS